MADAAAAAARLTEQQALAQIASDLGLEASLVSDPPVLLLAAAEDLGIILRGSSAAGAGSGNVLLRASIRLVCDELGIDHGWGWQPQPDQDGDEKEQPRNELGLVPASPAPRAGASAQDEAELTDDEKVAAIFAKFDVDGDGLMAWTECSAYCYAKEGEALEPEAWAQICSALSVEPSTGMTLADFQRMYEMTRGEGNDIHIDYMRLCAGLRITASAAPISQHTPLLVRIARTETDQSSDGGDLYVVEVTEEDDDYAISSSSYRFADFVALRKALEKVWTLTYESCISNDECLY